MNEQPETQSTSQPPAEKDRNVPVGVPISFAVGLISGVLIGVLTGNITFWLVVGMVGGVLFGQTVGRSIGAGTLDGINIYEAKERGDDAPSADDSESPPADSTA